MKRTVWKFSFELKDGPQPQDIPRGSKLLMVAKQDHSVCMWLEVDADRPRDTCYFTIIGTGHPVPDDAGYKGSCLDGPFVWHLYEVLP